MFVFILHQASGKHVDTKVTEVEVLFFQNKAENAPDMSWSIWQQDSATLNEAPKMLSILFMFVCLLVFVGLYKTIQCFFTTFILVGTHIGVDVKVTLCNNTNKSNMF